MNRIKRRSFLAATTMGSLAASRLALAASDRVLRGGVIGCGWYGNVDIKAAFKAGGVQFDALCDVDSDLDGLLGRALKPETVVLTGINTDTCVYATTFGAAHRGYQPVVISDCVASMRGLDHHWMALELMSRSIAWVLTVDEFKAKVQTTKVLEPVAAA